MKSQMTWRDIQNLERSFDRSDQTKPSWKSQLSSLWQTIVARLAITDEPHVWKSGDDQGYKTWNAYDPKTGRSVYGLSTAEMQTWLEERYYQVF